MVESGNNRVALVGQLASELTFSHTLFGEAFYTGTIAVPRLSGTVDLLPITASERLLPSGAPVCGANVAVKGQLRSYNKCVDGCNRLILTVFAHAFEPSEAEAQNEIVLEGYICKAPVYRTTPFHREIADLLLAVNRAYNKSDYIPCITWGRSARYVQGLAVGARVEAVGRVQSREYQKTLDNGMTISRTAFEVSVSSLFAFDA